MEQLEYSPIVLKDKLIFTTCQAHVLGDVEYKNLFFCISEYHESSIDSVTYEKGH